MSKGRILLFLLLITFISVLIRFYQLGNIPNGLATDEADIGYNAYSILKTGTDVYGRRFPLFFQSLDDYKPGLVFYITIPAIAAFGLSDFSVRLAAAVFGSTIPVLTFMLVKLLYPKNNYLPYLSATLMSFAPWNISLSRAMIQYIPLIFLYLLFFVLFLFTQKEYLKTQVKLILLFLSFVFLSLTLYVYYAAIIYLSFILLTITFIYRDFLKKNFKIIFVGFSLLVILSLPAFLHYKSQESRTRLNAISVLTADVTLPSSIAEIEQDKLEGQPFSQLIHNRRLVYLSALLDNYFDYFNLDYLFVTTKNTRYFYINGVGLFYLIELPFFLYGLYTLVMRRERSDLLLLALLIIGPVPAMITLGSPFPHRALLTILSIQLISATGLANFLRNFNILRAIPNQLVRESREVDRKIKLTNFSVILSKAKDLKVSSLRQLADRTIIFVLFFIYGASVYFFLHQYFVHSPKEFSSEFYNGAWFSTVRDVIPIVNANKDKYEKVIFTWSQGRLVPAVYFLFYNQVDPRILQAKSAGWTNESPSYKQIYNRIDNIEFRSINWETDKNLKNTLLIGYPEEFPQDVKAIDKTYLPNGNVHFVFVEAQ